MMVLSYTLSLDFKESNVGTEVLVISTSVHVCTLGMSIV